jgi:hypothetical protein
MVLQLQLDGLSASQDYFDSVLNVIDSLEQL